MRHVVTVAYERFRGRSLESVVLFEPHGVAVLDSAEPRQPDQRGNGQQAREVH